MLGVSGFFFQHYVTSLTEKKYYNNVMLVRLTCWQAIASQSVERVLTYISIW